MPPRRISTLRSNHRRPGLPRSGCRTTRQVCWAGSAVTPSTDAYDGHLADHRPVLVVALTVQESATCASTSPWHERSASPSDSEPLCSSATRSRWSGPQS